MDEKPKKGLGRKDIVLRLTERERERLIDVQGKEGAKRITAMLLKWIFKELERKEKQYGLNGEKEVI